MHFIIGGEGPFGAYTVYTCHNLTASLCQETLLVHYIGHIFPPFDIGKGVLNVVFNAAYPCCPMGIVYRDTVKVK